MREDAPITVKGWHPENYSREYFGPVTLTKALSLSLNTVAVRLGLEVGPKTVVETAHRLGIASDLQPNASIALGTSEVTPLELVAAYAPFANGGIGVQPHVIVARAHRATASCSISARAPAIGRVIDPQYVAMMNTMMQETLLTGTARKAELPGWQAAGKTGTSQDWRDAWFVGYTSHLVAGVWLGNDDDSPTKKVSGGNLPVEIWSRFMREAHKGVPVADTAVGHVARHAVAAARGSAWPGPPAIAAAEAAGAGSRDFASPDAGCGGAAAAACGELRFQPDEPQSSGGSRSALSAAVFTRAKCAPPRRAFAAGRNSGQRDRGAGRLSAAPAELFGKTVRRMTKRAYPSRWVSAR